MRESVNLDFLRSVAVLLVVHAHFTVFSGHAGSDGWSGITGVCTFFVHTSLVLMWSLERDPDVGHFYVRRIFRLYPLWIATLLLVLLFHLPQSPAFVFRMPGAVKFIANLLLLSNLFSQPDIVGASWTLPLEVDMYVFLPILFFFARSNRKLWPLLLVNCLIILQDVRLQQMQAVPLGASTGPQLSTLFPGIVSSLPMCVPYFLPGIMAYVLMQRKQRSQLPSWTFPVFLFALMAVDRHYGSFRGSWLYCLVLGLSLASFAEMTWSPLRAASHYVARYSYGIYLTHTAALVLAIHILRNHSMVLRCFAFTIVFVGAPVALYHLIEKPMIRVGARLASQFGKATVPRVTEKVLATEPAP